jgi:thymidylate synthase
MNPEIKDFYQFTVDDFELRDYNFGPKIANIPVAV